MKWYWLRHWLLSTPPVASVSRKKERERENERGSKGKRINVMIEIEFTRTCTLARRHRRISSCRDNVRASCSRRAIPKTMCWGLAQRLLWHKCDATTTFVFWRNVAIAQQDETRNRPAARKSTHLRRVAQRSACGMWNVDLWSFRSGTGECRTSLAWQSLCYQSRTSHAERRSITAFGIKWKSRVSARFFDSARLTSAGSNKSGFLSMKFFSNLLTRIRAAARWVNLLPRTCNDSAKNRVKWRVATKKKKDDVIMIDSNANKGWHCHPYSFCWMF